jgi:hypothetical protein
MIIDIVLSISYETSKSSIFCYAKIPRLKMFFIMSTVASSLFNKYINK